VKAGWVVLAAVSWAAAAETPTAFRISGEAGTSRVQIVVDGGRVAAESPAEGLWSIACDWKDGWPADWHHGSPSAVDRKGEWTILRGTLEACGGTWQLEDAYRPEGAAIAATRRVKWTGKTTVPRVTLAIRWQTAAATSANALLPGIIYYGNPSGARSGRVPVWTARPGEEAQFEEHRYPMPFAFLELADARGRYGVALHSSPSPAQFGNLKDQWWSLGVARAGDDPAELKLLSGPCAVNGMRSSIKAYQREFKPYDDAWLNVEAGAVIEKQFWLEAFPVAREGSGFQRPVHTSLALFAPYDLNGLPTIKEILRAKYRYALTRWAEQDGAAGFLKYRNRRQIVMGWTGQAEALGYALPVLDRELGDKDARRKAQATLDFISTAQFYEGGFRDWYDMEARKWSGDELLNQGQAMLAIARAIRNGRTNGMRTAKWERFLRRAAEFHSQRILAAGWRPVSTNEAAFIAPLVMSYRLFGDVLFRRAALKAGEHYADRHLAMKEPYWGGTLDARSEDKEGAAAAFQGFLELYEMTRSAKHLEWARHACDVALTYVVDWDIDMPSGRLRDHRFRTHGWTAVSPQNMHLDVWGAIMAPDVYRLGQIERRDELKQLGLVMYRTCGQMIDAYGSQGEQMEQTNYVQRTKAYEIGGLRGGYNEDWTVFWITAHFFTGAARLKELGVEVWR
jgi:hypothetical protein